MEYIKTNLSGNKVLKYFKFLFSFSLFTATCFTKICMWRTSHEKCAVGVLRCSENEMIYSLGKGGQHDREGTITDGGRNL